MVLEDEEFNEAIEHIIRTQMVNAEYAVAGAGDDFSQMFSSMDDDYMKARAADIKDISERLVNNLCGREDGARTIQNRTIVVVDDLSPSETVQMDKDKLLAFVTVHGSNDTGHPARMMIFRRSSVCR